MRRRNARSRRASPISAPGSRSTADRRARRLGLALALGPWPQGLAAGTLGVGGPGLGLFGIIIPRVWRPCGSRVRPPRCAPAAVLVLEDKVTGFVRCEIVRQGRDGIPEGVCGVRGRDLFAPREDL